MEMENNWRNIEHRQEKLLVTSINENRSSNKFLSAMIGFYGRNSRIWEEEVQGIIWGKNDLSDPLLLPPDPKLVIVTYSESSNDENQAHIGDVDPEDGVDDNNADENWLFQCFCYFQITN